MHSHFTHKSILEVSTSFRPHQRSLQHNFYIRLAVSLPALHTGPSTCKTKPTSSSNPYFFFALGTFTSNMV